MNARPWRVVTVDQDGDVIAHYGLMHDEAPARRVQLRFADRGAVLQHRQPPTMTWETIA